MIHPDAAETDRHRGAGDQQSRRRHARCAEALDQPAGDKSRTVHRHHMPLDPEVGGLLGKAVHMHGERRGGHQKIHYHIGHRAAEHRGGKARLADNLAQRPPSANAGRRGLCWRHACQQNGGERRHQRLSEEGEGEGMSRPEVHGAGDQHRANDPGGHAAAHHQRQRAGATFRSDAVGGGKAKTERHRGIGAAKHRGETKQQKRAQHHRQSGRQTGNHPGAGTGHKRGFAAPLTRQRAERQNRGRHPQHKQGDRQRGQRRAGGDGIADDSASGVEHHRVGAGQRLSDGQADDIVVLRRQRQHLFARHPLFSPV